MPESCNRKQRNTPETIRTGWEPLRRLRLCSTAHRSRPLPGCWHIVSLYDMCFDDGTHYDISTWDEKITDSLNYLFLLKAIVKEGDTD